MIQRSQKVEQSIQEYVRGLIFGAQKYPETQVEILDAWDGEKFSGTLDKNYIAMGFNFDDGGKEGEVGSNLVRKLVTVEFFVVATNATWGRNLSSALTTALESDRVVPLLDIGEPGQPQIDALPVITCSSEHQPIANPQPWQRFIWTVHLRLEDEYQVVL
jgi:hypothetical protein